MSGISSGVGLVSGINYQSLITQLVAIDSQPEQIVQSQITEVQAENTAYASLTTQLSGIQTIGNQLALPQTFQAADANSSNPSVITATAAQGAAVGSYQFQVAQLVTTQQSITNGFANATTAPVGAGTLTIEEGDGQAYSQTPLSQLNGGAGVQRGQFRITDRSGNSAIIDTSDAVTLDDVVNDINSASNISVHATLSNTGIVLTDTSGKTANDLTVTDLGGGSAAASLGIAQDAESSNVITGSNINTLGTATQLGTLNDGRGITTASSGADFQVNLSDGSTIKVTLGSAQTLGDVIKAINTAGGGILTASVAPGGQSIELQDGTTGSGTLSVTALNGSKAAQDLGLTATASGSTLVGNDVLAGLDSVLVSSLNGGNGIPLGQIQVTDGAGNTGTFDLSSAQSFSDVLNLINTDAKADGVDITASLNPTGTGIQLNDTSGGSGGIVVSDVNSTTASALGIAGTTDSSTVVGKNLQRQYISQNTLLSTLNGGQGINFGSFSILNSTGSSTIVNLAQGTYNTVGDVINAINNAHAGVTASINANGNGILLTDTAGGVGKLTVKDVNGSSAADLNLAGTATATTIDGAFEKTITVKSTDTLTTLQTAINNLGFGVTASIVNDGSSTNPYRLSLTSLNSGAAGSVIIDGGTTNLNPTTLVKGQDAAVFLGGGDSGSSQPLLLTSSTNQLTNVIKGVTINLTGAASQPVTLNITNDPSNVASDLSNFVQEFNTLMSQIGTYTQYNTTTSQGGLLLGDGTTQQIQETLYNVINSSVSGAGQYNSLAQIGITVGDNAQLSFDTDTFSAAFAADPQAVQNLFSQATTGFGNTIAKAVTDLTDPVSGVITLQENTLDTRITNYQSYYQELNQLVQQQQQLLEQQFANLEGTIASLQSQQQVLSAFTGATAASSASSAASTGSSSSSSSGTGSSSSSATPG